MPVASISVVLVVAYVSDKILEHFIQEVWYRRIWYSIFPPKKYRVRLIEVIMKTIQEYEEKFPYNPADGHYPFYQSEICFNFLCNFILYKKGSIEEIRGEFKKFPKIRIPTNDELLHFYSFFKDQVDRDMVLKELFVEENYKAEIFAVSQGLLHVSEKIESIHDILQEQKTFWDNERLMADKIIQALSVQVQRQLSKQSNSEKYLRDTFVETGIQKDFLRYLCDPMLYTNKCMDEISLLDFRHINRILSRKNHPLFTFDVSAYRESCKELTVENVQTIVEGIRMYLEDRKKSVSEIMVAQNDVGNAGFKLDGHITKFKYLESSVALVTEMAGQGKTNFICDFVENVLTKRNIPAVFLTGAEIDEVNIRKSILTRVFPGRENTAFDEFIGILDKYCREQNRFFVIVVDGLNENLRPLKFGRSLEQFLSEILEYKFIRVILSCRTEYYENNFSNLEKSTFRDKIQKISHLGGFRPDDELGEKLFEIYLAHFKIRLRGISKSAKGQLVANFLLLRIFCEVYKEQQLDFIDDIYKEELFERYFTIKTQEIGKRLGEESGKTGAKAIDIKNFVLNIIRFMIETDSYVNIPMDRILQEDSNKDFYVRFLDENILIRKDPGGVLLGNIEVVNFTFDEFRDFLISRYLVDNLLVQNEEEFKSFISRKISSDSPLMEGCSTFLFFISKRNGNSQLEKILRSQPWYNHVFAKNIFSLKNSFVAEQDKLLLREVLRSDKDARRGIIWNLIVRFDHKSYPVLNNAFLFEFLRTLQEKEYNEIFVASFSIMERWNQHHTIDQNELVKQLRNALEQRDIAAHPHFHGVFELLVYMFNNENAWQIISLFERYAYQFPEYGNQHLRKALTMKNEALRRKIQTFVRKYEIQL